MRKLALLTALFLLGACAGETPQPNQPNPTEQPMRQETESSEPQTPQSDQPTVSPEELMEENEFRLTSAAFEQSEPIPPEYSCDGQNISPSLTWTSPPEGTQSLALIMDDPDAPAGTWVHWVLFNLPAEARSLPEAVDPDPILNNGAAHGSNSWNAIGYGGPCPPSGEHRYFFKLYALDGTLDLESGATKEQVLEAMLGHIVGQAELMGTYSR